MEREDILIFDTETNSRIGEEADLKWFGAYSYLNKEFYLLPYTEIEQIKNIIKRHSVLIGFNNDGFDNLVLLNSDIDVTKYKKQSNGKYKSEKNNIDLLKISKDRLHQMGVKVKNFKLKTIVDYLKLDEFGKSEIDYKIFQKDEWSKEEIIEIKKYLKQDVVITKNLFEWFLEKYKPLKKYLSEEQQENFIHIKASLSSLACQCICNITNTKIEWEDDKEKLLKLQNEKILRGGYFLKNREKCTVGDMISIDISSAYPHGLIMGNLLSDADEGFGGEYNLRGIYNNKKHGKVEEALKQLFLERLKAKKEGDKTKSQAYKIVINSFYGLLGNPKFKTFYSDKHADDCTRLARTWLKRMAKMLEVNGFYMVYGFTDNIYVKIPKQSSKEELMFLVDNYIEEIKKTVPFPQDTFTMEVEKEIKMIWIHKQSNYITINHNNELKYTHNLFNKNTPKIVMNVFNNYMTPRIIKNLDVQFSEQELKNKILELAKEDLSLVCQIKNIKRLDQYKVKTSNEYKLSQRYGDGEHLLIPNLKNAGVGKTTNLCTMEDFERKNLTYKDVDIKNLMNRFKPFITKSEQEQLK